MKIALLHTARVHVDTFDHLFTDSTVELQLEHVVAPELLDRARSAGLEAVRADVEGSVLKLSEADVVMCTCSTLGPLADEIVQTVPNLLRIDRPLMEKACADGANILVALCLESTRQSTLDLLRDCARKLGREIHPTVVICDGAWAHFEAGDMEAYANSIAASIMSEISRRPETDSIVLAQASMRVAEGRLETLGIPVRSSPALAAERCIEVARNRSATGEEI